MIRVDPHGKTDVAGPSLCVGVFLSFVHSEARKPRGLQQGQAGDEWRRMRFSCRRRQLLVQ